MFYKFNSKRKNVLYNKLSDDLEKKFVKFEESKHQVLIQSIFEWNDFKEIFIIKHCQFTFVYKTVIFTIFNCGNYAEFWIDGEENTSYIKFSSAEKLLNNLLVEGNLLKNIWDNLVIGI